MPFMPSNTTNSTKLAYITKRLNEMWKTKSFSARRMQRELQRRLNGGYTKIRIFELYAPG